MLILTVASLYINQAHGVTSVQVPALRMQPDYGIVGNVHAGKTRVRSTGEVVHNLRQFTAVHAGEMGKVADALGIPFVDPAWIKADICFACPALEHFTKTLVVGTKLVDASGRAVLEVKGVTDPCTDAGAYIASHVPHLGVDGKMFPKLAYGRRGVYGIALEDVTIKLHDTFTVVLPHNASDA